MDKIFHVFISSTYSDLKEERKKVSEAVAKAGFVAEGMEIFPASSQRQMDFIERVIDRCDYYVLIVAGRYGSVSEDGISFTEKEFRYAKSKGIPVLAFVREDMDGLPVNKSENDNDKKEKLHKLIEGLKSNTIIDYWSNPDQLSMKTLAALSQARVNFEGIGWIRGDRAATSDILNEINELRKENNRLRNDLGNLELDIPLPDLPNHTDTIRIDIAANFENRSYNGSNKYGSDARIDCSWIELFPFFYSNIEWSGSDWNEESYYFIEDDKSCIKIGSAIASFASGLDTGDAFRLTKNSFETLKSYFIEVGLMSPNNTEEPFTVSAKKFARRQRINSIANASTMNIVEGKITMAPQSVSPDLDDEIPF